MGYYSRPSGLGVAKMQEYKVIVGRCVHKGEPIICTGLCNTVSCPLPWRVACGIPDEPNKTEIPAMTVIHCPHCGGEIGLRPKLISLED